LALKVRKSCNKNKIEASKIQHNKSGGRGQMAKVKDGIAWIERAYKLKSENHNEKKNQNQK